MGLFVFPGRRLRYQVALGVAAGFVAIGSLLALLIFSVIDQSTDVTGAERLKLARTTAAAIDALVGHALQQLERFASADFVRVASSRQREEMLAQAFHLMGSYNQLFLLDDRGELVWAYPAAPQPSWPDLATHPFARTALETGATSVGLVNTTTVDHPPVVAVAVPLHDGAGRIVGAVAGRLHLAHGWKVPLIPLPPGSATFVTAVVDEHGTILAMAGGPEPDPGRPELVKVDPHAAMLAPLLRAGTPGVRVHGGEGEEEHLVAFAPLRRLPAGVVVEEREDVALAVPHRLRRILLFLGVVALVATSAGAWLHARYVTRPLEGLERAMRRIAAGALDEPVRVSRGDEIGMLARSFEAMRLQLKRAMDERDRWEQELEARVRERTDEVRSLLARIIHAQEEERRRLARELHDDTAQTVATLLVQMAALRESLPPGQERARELLDRALAQGGRTLAEIRRVIADLRPTALDDLGLIPALRAYAEERLTPAGVKLDFLVTGAVRRLHPPTETALFRILQEAVTNVARHARARTARVQIDFTPTSLTGIVEDDGRGFEMPGRPRDPRAGVGLQGMRERADLIRARLQITSRPGAGTRVRVEVPLEVRDER